MSDQTIACYTFKFPKLYGIDLKVGPLLDGKSEVALSDLKRAMSNAGHNASGPEIARSLDRLDWARDGWLYTGYDRTPRWVRRHVA